MSPGTAPVSDLDTVRIVLAALIRLRQRQRDLLPHIEPLHGPTHACTHMHTHTHAPTCTRTHARARMHRQRHSPARVEQLRAVATTLRYSRSVDYSRTTRASCIRADLAVCGALRSVRIDDLLVHEQPELAMAPGVPFRRVAGCDTVRHFATRYDSARTCQRGFTPGWGAFLTLSWRTLRSSAGRG